MAESTLTKPYDDLRAEVGRFLGWGRSYYTGTIAATSGVVTLTSGIWPTQAANWRLVVGGSTYTVNTRDSNTQITLDDTSSASDSSAGTAYVLHPWTDDQVYDIDHIMRDGVLQFLQPPALPPDRTSHQWKFLRPVSQITIFNDVTGTVSGQGTYSASTDKTTITATASKFYATMEGLDFTFDTSSTDYEITDYDSATQIKVSGDASSETSGDTFTITSTGDFRLPDNFGGIDGDVTFFNDTTVSTSLVSLNEEQIRRKRQGTTVANSKPFYYAVRPVSFDATIGQRWEMLTYPTPDSTYTMEYRGLVNPDIVTATNKYVGGGMPHALTLKESILSCAERQQHDSEGVHYKAFLQCLRTSIDQDRASVGAETVGPNLDRSARSRRYGSRHELYEVYTTYEGTQYGPN